MLTSCALLESKWDQAIDPSDTTEVVFEVPQGANARSLGPALETEGLIGAGWQWEAYVRLNKAGSCLKAGRFSVSRLFPDGHVRTHARASIQVWAVVRAFPGPDDSKPEARPHAWEQRGKADGAKATPQPWGEGRLPRP